MSSVRAIARCCRDTQSSHRRSAGRRRSITVAKAASINPCINATRAINLEAISADERAAMANRVKIFADDRAVRDHCAVVGDERGHFADGRDRQKRAWIGPRVDLKQRDAFHQRLFVRGDQNLASVGGWPIVVEPHSITSRFGTRGVRGQTRSIASASSNAPAPAANNGKYRPSLRSNTQAKT
jgi:hypothetical protein